MIYVIGDSFTWGYNFIYDKINKFPITRKEKIYSTHLGQLLNQEVVNLSLIGASNWRTARIISNLNLNHNDLVVINWSESGRLELGSSNKQMLFTLGEQGTLPIISLKDVQNLEENHYLNELKENFPFGEFIEKDENLYLRRIFVGLNLDKAPEIINQDFVNFVKKFYGLYASIEWLEEIFKIMFMSTVYKLNKNNIPFVMFNSFNSPYHKKTDVFNIPNYLCGYEGNMCNFLRNNNDINYWNEDEHIQIAEIVANYFKEVL